MEPDVTIDGSTSPMIISGTSAANPSYPIISVNIQELVLVILQHVLRKIMVQSVAK
jgi:hypothetical protein